MIGALKRRLRTYIDAEIDRRMEEFKAVSQRRDFLESIAQGLMRVPTVWDGRWDRVTVGENVHLVNALLNVSSGRITIGDHTFFGHNVSILTGTHYVEKKNEERQDYPREGRDIIIGNGVWIASNATILGPCRIGDDAIVAAGSVVTCQQIEPGSVYAGVPARRIR